MLFHLIDNLLKNIRPGSGQFREHFPIYRYVLLFKLAQKLAVGQTQFPSTRVYSDIPEPAEIALLFFAAADRVLTRVHNGFHGGAKIRLPVADVAFGSLDYFFASCAFLNASFDSRHLYGINSAILGFSTGTISTFLRRRD